MELPTSNSPLGASFEFHNFCPLQVVLRYDSGRGPVTALAVSPEGCFLAGGWALHANGESRMGDGTEHRAGDLLHHLCVFPRFKINR